MNENYVKITSRHDANDVQIKAVGSPPEWGMQFSLDGLIWATYSAGTVVRLNTGDSIWFRNDTGTMSISNTSYYQIETTTSFNASGDMSTIFNYNVDKLGSIPSNSLNYFFKDSIVVDASQLVLPDVMSGYACASMFKNCYSLGTPPQLPATTLARACYSWMFQDCRSLKSAPQLPATTLADICYSNMFYGCSAMTQVPPLPAAATASNCYEGIFTACRSLDSITCEFTEFDSTKTASWLNNVSPTGRFFYTSKSLDVASIPRNSSGVPAGWTVLRGIPQHKLKLNSKPVRFLLVNGNMVDLIGSRRLIPVPGDPLAWFDAIDNVDFDVHSTDTQTWYNLAEDKSITAERTSQWTWGDDAALFTEQYNQVFKVVQSGDSILNSMGNEWSIHISAYLDVASKRTYVGLFGGEPNSENAVAPAVALDGTGWLFLKGNPTSSTTINSTNWNWFGKVNSYLKYDDFNTLTVVASPQRRALFINGQIAWEDNTQLADYKTLLRTVVPRETHLYIGRSSNQNLTSGSGRVIRGKVHNFLIYRRALIDDECRSLYTYSNERFNS